MGSKYPVLSPDEIIKILNKFGFRKVSQKESHVKLRKEEPIRIAIIPMHYAVAKGTLQSILA